MKKRFNIKKWATYRDAAVHVADLRALKPEGEFQVRKRRDGFAVVERFDLDVA